MEDGVGVEEEAGITFLITSFMRSSAILALSTVSSCWVEMSTVCTRWGVAPPSFLYSMVTWVLPSGRTQGQVPFLRTSVGGSRWSWRAWGSWACTCPCTPRTPQSRRWRSRT